jgi:hypothetical protein
VHQQQTNTVIAGSSERARLNNNKFFIAWSPHSRSFSTLTEAISMPKNNRAHDNQTSMP